MRKLLLVVGVVVISSGCMPRRIAVASTPEGNECKRQCMVVSAACREGKRSCRNRENECLATCPGAVVHDD
jgi:hypothetical protein